MILSAAYALYVYRRVIFGELVKPACRRSRTSAPREIAILAPLVVITILMGVYPKPVFDVTSASVANLIARVQDGAGHRPRAAACRAHAGSRQVSLHADLIVLLPELIVAVGAMALLIGGVMAGDSVDGSRFVAGAWRCWRSPA